MTSATHYCELCDAEGAYPAPHCDHPGMTVYTRTVCRQCIDDAEVTASEHETGNDVILDRLEQAARWVEAESLQHAAESDMEAV